jgi:hypothetical protein
MKFCTSWTDFVTTAYDTKLQCIVKSGKMPEQPEIDVAELQRGAPSEKDLVLMIIFETKVMTIAAANTDLELNLKQRQIVIISLCGIDLGSVNSILN